MGKRSDFERRPRDFYPTPADAVTPLLPHLNAGTRFVEPCAGDGALLDHLQSAGHDCHFAHDIEPKREDIGEADALKTWWPSIVFDCFITNPPWDRKVLHPLIVHLSDHRADVAAVRRRLGAHPASRALPPRLRKIVSVGRVKWIPDSPFTGKDNCAWHLFDRPADEPAVFFGRAA
jgi:hypothetical protein